MTDALPNVHDLPDCVYSTSPAAAIILGCTELPLAFPEQALDGVPLIDPAMALAGGLICASDATRLKPWIT